MGVPDVYFWDEDNRSGNAVVPETELEKQKESKVQSELTLLYNKAVTVTQLKLMQQVEDTTTLFANNIEKYKTRKYETCCSNKHAMFYNHFSIKCDFARITKAKNKMFWLNIFETPNVRVSTEYVERFDMQSKK